MNTGVTKKRTEELIIVFKLVVCSPINEAMPTVPSHLFGSSIKVRANTYSFQVAKKVSAAIVISAGVDKGKTILKRTPSLLQPSIIAASSIARGIVVKNPINIHILKGRAKPRSAIIKPGKVLINPHCLKVIYNGVTARTSGII